MASQRLSEVAVLFFKLGLIGFGGPAAHIALMEEEVVKRRQWLTREHFLDLVGVTNLIPGPNSTEMAIHLGYLRAGWLGLIVAGVAFILPAVLITVGFAWGYVALGTLPQLTPVLRGIQPVVLAVLLVALVRLSKKALKRWDLAALAGAVVLGSLLGWNEILLLLGCGVVGMLWRKPPPAVIKGAGLLALSLAAKAQAAVPISSGSLGELGWFFLKVGSVLFGSGYVLVAFLEGGLVNEYHWLTRQQILDAIAIGQFTPGPVLSTAAFIGYVLAGGWGAVVASVGIFLPSFFFVAALNPAIPWLQRSPWARAFLDAVNAGSVALMFAVTLKLAQSALTSWPTALIALAATGAGFYLKLNPAWLVLGGGLLGWVVMG
ncbi:chromate efflux transporter [Anthocerotibacter panamensis]|uniref:chromate efflux transporter n=1 Tax=Anthocerotibacter panamensis TaxID=2857077 RepID=UPI001C404C3B|nr:chromate efflux transporter [Anthocerotibacter panamensis]